MLNRIDHVLNADEIATLTALFTAVAPVAGSSTAQGLAAEVKHNQQLPPEHPAVQDGARIVLEALKRSTVFHHTAFPRRAYPPMFSRYEPGMQYGEHVDNAIMLTPAQMRTDVAVTLFLSEPGSYDGGELMINTGHETRAVKLPAGSLIAYPPYFLHRVAPVTRGVRLAAITWVESLVRDPQRRLLLEQMDRAMGGLHERHGESAELNALNNSYHSLLRMWAET